MTLPRCVPEESIRLSPCGFTFNRAIGFLKMTKKIQKPLYIKIWSCDGCGSELCLLNINLNLWKSQLISVKAFIQY